ncbi:chromosome segregation protein SMC [Thermodesulfovibrio sp. 3907-1M]|uniref:Chromosome segregation protein SMC n=1 Tax=Thermodesulfovibrio autotrophicus TaxID=3118333 RepID=A0AAU8GV27_9BACT
MRIRWIELNGFKSFPEKTRIELNEGITCFVGPNGAGKSNIVDAFRWVLGEHNPRILRGEKMEEVIFQGSQSKKEKGIAEVTILLKSLKEPENGGQPEAELTEIKRRFYKTGESYFIINGKQARLKDIKEIFLSEGVDVRTYSIIDQIKINEILSKPSHRKALLEECAGISLYKLKKNESEGKLQSAQENLQRIEDIISELKKQYSLLERQAKKAEKYKKTMEELKNLELKVSKAESLNLLKEIEKLREDIQILENTQLESKEKNEKIIKKINEQKIKISYTENLIQEREKELKQKEIEKTKAENQQTLMIQEEKSKRELINKLHEENSALKREIEKSQNDLKSACIEYGEIEENIANLQKEIIQKEQELMNFYKEINEIEKEIEKQRKILFNLTTELVNKKNYYQSINKSSENAQNRLNTLYIRKKETIQRINQMETEIQKMQKNIKNLKESLQLENNKNKAIQNQLYELENQLETKTQLIIEKKKQEAVINGKIEALLSEIWQEDKNHKLFFECIDVSPEVEELIEAVLEERLKASVIQDIETIKDFKNKGWFFLKNTELSSAYQKDETHSDKKIKSYIRIKESGINEKIFDNVYIVNNLKEAMEIKKEIPNCCFVTRKGEVFFPDGFIKTGKTSNLLKKKRMLEDLNKEKSEISEEIEYLQHEIEKMQATKQELKREIESKRLQISQIQKEIFKAEEKNKSLHREMEQTKQRTKYMENEEKALQNEISHNTKVMEKTRSEIEQLSMEIEALERTIEELKNKQKEISQANESQKEELSSKKIILSTLKERYNNKKQEINRLNEEIKKLTMKQQKNEEEIEQSLKRLSQIEKEKTEILKTIEMLTLETFNLKEQIEKLYKELQNEKEYLIELEKNYQSINEKLHNITAELGEKKTIEGEKKVKLENLWNEIYSIYGIDIIKEEIEPAQETETFKSRITQLKNQLKEIGAVDVEILKEYEDVKERYNFLIAQKQDIVKSIEELQEAIKKINSLTKKKLRETFNLLKERFNSLFNELFEGGKAEIFLTDENNILESEIEMQIQPPGKKAGNINLLSGGEKDTYCHSIHLCLLEHPFISCMYT